MGSGVRSISFRTDVFGDGDANRREACVVRIGYYNHIPCLFDGRSVRIPSTIGMFVTCLSRVAREPITVFAHRARAASGIEDMTIGPEVANVIDLGYRTSAPARLLKPGAARDTFVAHRHEIDVMLIHAPTPLLPALVSAAGSTPVVLLVWGDYGSWVAQSHFSTWRNMAIRWLLREYGRRQRRAARGRLAFIQNPGLAKTVEGATEIRPMAFSTVSRGSVGAETEPRVWPEGTGRTSPVKLLYAGRIVRDKGLLEAVEAVALLRDAGFSAELELVGWIGEGDPIGSDIAAVARELGVGDRVTFGGYVPTGPRLMARYAQAHVFVLPTYWDSLPRSMMEAMAAGLPVVVSPVGGIGHYLRDRETAMFVEPRSASSVAGAVRELIEDQELRLRIARAGREWSLQHSVENDCEEIVAEVTRRWRDRAAGERPR
jgi:glycosyltransferase involved in cell wall biosynthesis